MHTGAAPVGKPLSWGCWATTPCRSLVGVVLVAVWEPRDPAKSWSHKQPLGPVGLQERDRENGSRWLATDWWEKGSLPWREIAAPCCLM